jgi:hypothetical protein
MNMKIKSLTIILAISFLALTAFGQSNVKQTNSSGKTEILWDFRDKSSDDDKPQEFSKAENDVVMKYLFGNKQIKDFEITTRVTGSFTKANTKETLYYVGGCDDGDGFKAIANCSHASSWNAGWIAIYDGNKPIRKIEAALGYTVRFVTDVNGDGKEEILSLSGYSGMGETTVRGELGQISVGGYEKIFPMDDKFYFGSFQQITFSENENEADKCYALASVVNYVPTTDGKFPAFTEEYFKSAACDSNWTKTTKKQFDADQ